MDAFSKIKLTQPDMQAVVAAQFGSARQLASMQELKDGFFNAAALLTLDDATRVVIKAAPPADVKVLRYEKDILRAEYESMRLVRDRTSVPMPEILAYDPACSLLPSEYFLISFLSGEPFHKIRHELRPEQQEHVRREMGRITREISEIRGPAFGYWAQPEQPGVSWRECFGNMVEGVLRDGEDAGVVLPLPYDAVRERITACSAALDAVTEPQLVHWDLWDGNVFVDPASAQITGVIDFERVLWGDPLIEAIFGDLNPASPAVQGFGGGVLSTSEQQVRRQLYNAYLYLIMVIECAYRHYPNDDQENWTRPKLAETLAQLV